MVKLSLSKSVKEVYDEINTLISKEASDFLLMYINYGHLQDDIIDEPYNLEDIERCSILSYKIFSGSYWNRNKNYLTIVQELIHTLYFTSIDWEKSNVLWKRRDAKVLSHSGGYMLFAVLLLETNNMMLTRRLFIKFLESSHAEHITDLTKEEFYA